MLDQKFQERLDKWRKNVIPVPSVETTRSPPQRSYRAERDFGDDIRDFEKKDEEAWLREQARNPIYRGYK